MNQKMFSDYKMLLSVAAVVFGVAIISMTVHAGRDPGNCFGTVVGNCLPPEACSDREEHAIFTTCGAAQRLMPNPNFRSCLEGLAVGSTACANIGVLKLCYWQYVCQTSDENCDIQADNGPFGVPTIDHKCFYDPNAGMPHFANEGVASTDSCGAL